MAWWSNAQCEQQDRLVLYRLRGYPPWPGLVLPLKERPYLQSPMNPLAPPEDEVFDRVQTCVQRGKGMKVGDTVIARFAEKPSSGSSGSDPDSGSDSGSDSCGSVLPTRKEKAKVLEVMGQKLKVEYERTLQTKVIPKAWAELLSTSVLQTQKAGSVKRATGKVRDHELRGKQRGVVPSGFVLVYSFGDEMYRKVRATSLIEYSPDTVASHLHRRKPLEERLEEVKRRGFSGKRALREIRQEWDRRELLNQQRADAERYREYNGLEMPAASPPRPSPPREKRPFPGSVPTPVYRPSAPPPPRSIATPVLNAVRAVSSPPPPAPVHLQGHLVPYYEQLEGTGEQRRTTASELEEARQLLQLEATYNLSDLNRARRLRALKEHPDKALPALKQYAHNRWLEIDAAYNKLKRAL